MRGGSRAAGGLALLATVALLGSGPDGLAAELYRCVRPDGTVQFTDDASACPGSAPHQPSGSLQRIDAPPARAPGAPVPPASLEPDPSAAQEAAWRQKLRDARQERDRLAIEIARLEKAVAWCNRGGKLLEKDEAGLNREIPCHDVRGEAERKTARLEDLHRYLADGIHEECRLAGCLPGWLR